ncbi:MAG TPA: dethiobiotin synthase [Verrucomicrobiales bacterium]|nr:dethiobiotin synthase [Verrucomicrobiales bacterium]
MVFITGTDTGVGKTLMTALVLTFNRLKVPDTLACKPFCSGSRSDVHIIEAVMDGEFSRAQINPFYYSAPLAPLIAARLGKGPQVKLSDCLRHLKQLKKNCRLLVVEGAGGLMVPLGESFSLLDLIIETRSKSLLVAPNRLGVINAILLNISVMKNSRAKNPIIFLMNQKKGDISARFNTLAVKSLLPDYKVFRIPYLGADPEVPAHLKKALKKIRKTLAKVSEEL